MFRLRPPFIHFGCCCSCLRLPYFQSKVSKAAITPVSWWFSIAYNRTEHVLVLRCRTQRCVVVRSKIRTEMVLTISFRIFAFTSLNTVHGPFSASPSSLSLRCRSCQRVHLPYAATGQWSPLWWCSRRLGASFMTFSTTATTALAKCPSSTLPAANRGSFRCSCCRFVVDIKQRSPNIDTTTLWTR